MQRASVQPASVHTFSASIFFLCAWASSSDVIGCCSGTLAPYGSNAKFRSLNHASIATEEQSEATLNNNRLIALYGGGDHIVIDLDDPPDFLAKLKQTVDFKQVLTECAATPVNGVPKPGDDEEATDE